jgi:hypothetical protein
MVARVDPVPKVTVERDAHKIKALFPIEATEAGRKIVDIMVA